MDILRVPGYWNSLLHNACPLLVLTNTHRHAQTHTCSLLSSERDPAYQLLCQSKGTVTVQAVCACIFPFSFFFFSFDDNSIFLKTKLKTYQKKVKLIPFTYQYMEVFLCATWCSFRVSGSCLEEPMARVEESEYVSLALKFKITWPFLEIIVNKL